MYYTVKFVITLFYIDNVLLCVIYQTLTYLCMIHEYHFIYSIRYYPRFQVSAVGLRTYYARIWGHYCTRKIK